MTTQPRSQVPTVARRTAVLGRGEVAWDAPLVGADDLGLARGDGCFETLRVLGGPPVRILSLEAHLDRFERSAALLDLPAPGRAAWTGLVTSLVTDLAAGAEASLRLLLSRGLPGAGPVGIAMLRPVP
ncbi:MAG: aminotransferase class IV, partial [Janthinobacterium lividum]